MRRASVNALQLSRASIDMVTAAASTADVCTHAQAELEGMRPGCAPDVRDSKVIQALALCYSRGISPPEWLEKEFVRRVSLVSDAHLMDWNGAFGRYWPKHTRLDKVRGQQRISRRVHAAVWELVKADPTRPMTRVGVFEEVGEQLFMSAASVERSYYGALKDGQMNVDDWRRAHLHLNRSYRGKPRKKENGQQVPAA